MPKAIKSKDILSQFDRRGLDVEWNKWSKVSDSIASLRVRFGHPVEASRFSWFQNMFYDGARYAITVWVNSRPKERDKLAPPYTQKEAILDATSLAPSKIQGYAYKIFIHLSLQDLGQGLPNTISEQGHFISPNVLMSENLA